MQAARIPGAGDADAPARTPATWRFHVGALVVLALFLVPYVVGVLLPYLVNDLHRLPLAEVASGAHDPKDMWPYGDSVFPALVQVIGLLAVVLTPMAALGVLLAVSWKLWLGVPTSRGARVVGYVAALASLLVTGALWSPFGHALLTWRLD